MARKATNTKSRILQMTRTLYSTHGCDNTTLDDIITASGITKGAFYHYFKSKESLCEAVIDLVIADYQDLADTLDTDSDPIDQLQEMIAKLAKLNASGEWVNCRLILRLSVDSHQSQPHIQQKIHKFWKWETNFYEELITRCRQAEQLSCRLDATTQRQLLMSVMAGAIMLEKVAPSHKGFGELAKTIINMLK
jgi:TetR/AcrR family transcriptional repressor of nem operon